MSEKRKPPKGTFILKPKSKKATITQAQADAAARRLFRKVRPK